MTVGSTFTPKVPITPKDAGNPAVTWSTSNNKVATVDSNGKVKGIKAGTATITAKTNDGAKTASCTVTVRTTENYDRFKNNNPIVYEAIQDLLNTKKNL